MTSGVRGVDGFVRECGIGIAVGEVERKDLVAIGDWGAAVSVEKLDGYDERARSGSQSRGDAGCERFFRYDDRSITRWCRELRQSCGLRQKPGSREVARRSAVMSDRKAAASDEELVYSTAGRWCLSVIVKVADGLRIEGTTEVSKGA